MHKDQMTMIFFLLFFKVIVHTDGTIEQKKNLMNFNKILICRGNQKKNSHKQDLQHKNLKNKMTPPPKKKQPSLKPVCFESFQTFVFVLNS